MKRVIRLDSPRARKQAASQCHLAPTGCEVVFRERSRTSEQNARMWAMLDDISSQLEWHGMRLAPEDWKDFMMHALKRARWVPDEDGVMVPVGMSTSALGVSDMSDLLALIEEFGTRHGVKWRNNND